MSWLIPYNGEFETEEELIKIIENINIKINRQTNETIGVPPIMLFQKELITIHQISEKYINYKEEHYNEGFMNILKNKTQDEINEIARKNLELINKLSEV